MPTRTGRALKDVLRKHPPDPEWAGELRELREEVGALNGPRLILDGFAELPEVTLRHVGD